ncbi:hypothetical protein PV04_02860 [Phialophora macrospora]|uniref:Uncharacterized protein n=1 Tax=Phialophora macrospora TaxID=1851006 RepID=A0A0D2GEL6_9EURO|nr:hypothetical protein PV04_02860 [Phialophora macrospora]
METALYFPKSWLWCRQRTHFGGFEAGYGICQRQPRCLEGCRKVFCWRLCIPGAGGPWPWTHVIMSMAPSLKYSPQIVSPASSNDQVLEITSIHLGEFLRRFLLQVLDRKYFGIQRPTTIRHGDYIAL